MRALWAVSFEICTCMTLTLLLLLMLLLLSLLYKSQCWHIQLRKISHTKVVSEEVKEERKKEVVHEVRSL